MKKDIHPDYHYIPATCSCGNTLQVGTTCSQEHLQLDICSNCHPFYTGKQKLVDTSGRVEQFRRRFGAKTN
ncbi:50S ribosomal protein L31 [Candidatus Persebacteraceae bacterium Df01]|jgi:large subunit ribosomal protein L31|uniref:Large ribosomal subunit protein bL31 n=1 Tax=Candidatus Doriopsillibacter californiensis TaxID=2970740 RepID=A0ABT7QN46_9GAMM|nr:50S ribosomal protein L31 [Candidatus Persebacteraceae bacterium Df01]